MILVRSPLRVSLGGGGTDLPSYYHHHGGFLVSAAINKYVYVFDRVWQAWVLGHHFWFNSRTGAGSPVGSTLPPDT